MSSLAPVTAETRRRFVSVKEAAVIADRHPETIREALRSQELHGTQRTAGGVWKLHPECVIAWAEGLDCEHRAAERPVSLSQFRQRRTAQR